MIKIVEELSHNKPDESSGIGPDEASGFKTVKCKSNKRLAKARDYVKKGISVIPVKGKIPAIPWSIYRGILPSDEKLVEWFGEGSEYNIAIVTGKLSGIIVIDADTPEAVAMVIASGLSTACYNTGKGMHFLCQFKEGVTGFQGKASLPGIDLRSEGQLAVAPDSVHENGNIYTWVNELLEKDNLAELPDWVIATNPFEKLPIALLLEGVMKGMRNNALARVAGYHLHDNPVMTLDGLKKKLYESNNTYKPPLPKKEVDAIAVSIFKLHSKSKASESNQSDIPVADNEIFPVIPFPLKALPKRFRKLVNSVASSTQIDQHVISCIALTIISAAIGNSLRISPKDGWEAPPFLWIIIVAETGYGKSHAQRVLMQALVQLQKLEAQRFTKEKSDYDKKIVEWKKIKGEKPVEPEKPIPMVHYFSNDFTFETLVDIFESSPRGFLIFSDEVAGFLLSLNQYKSGGNDRQRLLQLFDAMPLKVDRKGVYKFVQHTGASMLGGIQPPLMPKIFKTEGHQDGLTSRFLYTRAKPRVQKFIKGSVPKEDLIYWEKLVNHCYGIKLLPLADNEVMSHTMHLSPEALEIWISFYERYHVLMQFLSPRAKGFVPKLIGYSLRLAGILTEITDQEELTQSLGGIQPGTVESAIALTEYFAGQAVSMLKLYDKPEHAEDERFVRLIMILYNLSGEVKHGKLPVSRIREEYNLVVPDVMQIPPTGQTLSKLLNKLGLYTETGTGNHSFLIWDDAKVQRIFAENSHNTHYAQPDVEDPDEDINLVSEFEDKL